MAEKYVTVRKDVSCPGTWEVVFHSGENERAAPGPYEGLQAAIDAAKRKAAAMGWEYHPISLAELMV